jgi:PST family polysaccharide transporter
MKESLSKLAVSGAKWISISQFSKQFVQYITTLILAILLSPKDFGVIAIAYMVIGFLNIFKDLGSSSAIIYKEKNNEDFLSSIFWGNALMGSLFSVIIFSFSYYLSVFFNAEVLDSIFKVLAFLFLISSLSIVQKSILEKSFSFKQLAKIETIAVIVGAILGIISALFGFGVWSLVIQAFASNLFLTSAYWVISDWKPKFIFKFEAIQPVVGYSLNLTGYNIFNYFVRNADYFLIGKLLGDNALGHYFLAYKIMLYPLKNISIVLSRVMFPIYSKIQNNNQKFSEVFTKTSKLIAIVSFPLMIIIFVFSNEITNTFFSTKWDVVLLSRLLAILAPIGIIQSIATTTGSIYQAKGRTDWMFKWGIFSSILYVGGFLIGIIWGVIGVAVSYLLVTYLLVYPVFAIPFKLINYRFIKYFLNLSNILILNILLLLILFSLKFIFYKFVHTEIIIMLFSLLIGSISYILLIKKSEKDLVLFFIQNFLK